jgi:hypothetical protein
MASSLPTLKDFAELVENKVLAKSGVFASRTADAVVQKVTGITIDRWGDVRNISQELIDEIAVKPTVVQYKTRVVQQIEDAIAGSKPLPASTMKHVVRRIQEAIEERIYEEMEGTIEAAATRVVQDVATQYLQTAGYRKFLAQFTENKNDSTGSGKSCGSEAGAGESGGQSGVEPD